MNNVETSEVVAHNCPVALRENYTELIEFGAGTHGIMFRSSQRVSGQQVIVKKVSKELPLKRIRTEIEAGTRLRGVSGIPHFHQYYEEPTSTWLVFDVAEGQDLLTWMEADNFRPAPEKTVRHIAMQIVRILCRVHQTGFAHKDIKLENIVYNSKDKQVHLIDFGLSYNMRREPLCRDFAGSKEYAAPEMLFSRSSFCPKKADVWSLGVTLYAMLFGMFPYPTDDEGSQRMMKTKRYPDLTFPRDRVSAEAKELLELMLNPNANERIDPKDLLTHPWFHYRSGSRNNSPAMKSPAMKSPAMKSPAMRSPMPTASPMVNTPRTINSGNIESPAPPRSPKAQRPFRMGFGKIPAGLLREL